LQNWKIDVAVLLTFFVRHETLEKVFESVRKAKPRVLLLWQDGPREGRLDDIENIEKCRKIVENIDWDCEVYKNYQEKNLGCDPSTFLAQKWAFSVVDKCIIMEDDRIPCDSFYQYCKELLDKYENDERINHICGTNLLGENENCDADYFFAPFGSTTWASWRRVAQGWDEEYTFLDDNQYFLGLLKERIGDAFFNSIYNTAICHKNTGKQYWETILGMNCMLNNRVAIIPKKNMIRDIGLTENATHAISNKKVISKTHLAMFDMPTYDMTQPINHPKYVLPDYNYVAKLHKISGIGHPFLIFTRKVSYVFKCMIHGEGKRVLNKLKAKFRGK
jgi:hypothetical protein